MPTPLTRRVRRLARPAWLGLPRRTRPLSESWGRDRGTPVDRHYIEAFLSRHSGDIRGRVLEIRDDAYARKFGTGIDHVEVLDVDAANERATIVADLSAAEHVPPQTFNCFILTQTLQYIPDVAAAIRQARRLLRPNGVLLTTVPGISRIDSRHREADLWRFTPRACSLLFEEAWSGDDVSVTASGNVLSAAAFLFGMASEELTRGQLEASDPNYPVVVCVRAVRRDARG
jgi:SAM-dependent methyltransferase